MIAGELEQCSKSGIVKIFLTVMSAIFNKSYKSFGHEEIFALPHFNIFSGLPSGVCQ